MVILAHIDAEIDIVLDNAIYTSTIEIRRKPTLILATGIDIDIDIYRYQYKITNKKSQKKNQAQQSLRRVRRHRKQQKAANMHDYRTLHDHYTFRPDIYWYILLRPCRPSPVPSLETFL